MSRLRLAVALMVTGPAAIEVDGLRRALGDRALGRIAPHVTLVPPVNVPAGQLDDVLAAVREAAAVVAPVALHLGPPATFWPVNPVVYLAVGGDTPEVARLRDAVLRPPLARPTTRPFVPHVTLAGDLAPDLIDTTVRALAGYSADLVVAHAAVLVERRGRLWEVIADAPLGGGRTVGRGGLQLDLLAGEILDPEATALVAREWSPAEGGDPPQTTRRWAVTARREGRVVGAATGTADDGELWVDRMVVDATLRGQGIGTQLLAEAELVGAGRGCRQGRLLCPADSAAASWFGGRGWRQSQRLVAWRGGRDYVCLVRPLGCPTQGGGR